VTAVGPEAVLSSPRRTVRVLYDHYAFVKQQRGGVSRYFAEVMKALRDHPELRVEPAVALRWTDNVHLLAGGMSRRPPSRLTMIARKTLLGSRGGVHASPARIPSSTNGIDLLHSTAFKEVAFRRDYAPIRAKVPHVVTIHDMIPEIHGSPHAGKAWFARDADGLIFVSETTREDYVEHCGPVTVPHAVIPHGIDERVFRPDGARSDQDYPSIVHVGSRGGYKRFDVLLAALGLLNRECRLITVGSPLAPEELALAERHGVVGRILPVVGASDKELAALLRSASAFVSSSSIEGFGIPALEAMACGAPTVLADTRIYREVGGTATLYFAEGSSEHLADVLRSLLDDPGLARRTGADGAQRAARFTWTRTASLTADLYHEVACV